jgi:uncharacterized membrane protein
LEHAVPLSALALVVLAGLIHATWNIAAKKAGGDIRFAGFTALILMVFWAPVGIWFALQHVPQWGGLEWALVVASAVLHVLYFTVLLRGYRSADLTVVYPLARGSGPVLSAVFAVLVLGEQISQLGVLGIAAVALGVFLIAGGPALWRTATDAAADAKARQRVRAGVYWGGLTGVFIASYTVVDAYAVKWAMMSPILVDYMGNLVRVLIISPVLLRDTAQTQHQWRQQWRYACVVGIFSPISYVLVLYAMQMAPLSHVAPAREISMLFAALLGGQLLGERDQGLRMLGALLIAAGVMALGW